MFLALNTEFGALHGHLFLHMLPASVHSMVVNTNKRKRRRRRRSAFSFFNALLIGVYRRPWWRAFNSICSCYYCCLYLKGKVSHCTGRFLNQYLSNDERMASSRWCRPLYCMQSPLNSVLAGQSTAEWAASSVATQQCSCERVPRLAGRRLFFVVEVVLLWCGVKGRNVTFSAENRIPASEP